MKNINDLYKKKKTTKNSSNLKVYFNIWKEKFMFIYLYILGWIIKVIKIEIYKLIIHLATN